MAIYEFKLPELGEGIHEGEIVKWHVQAGDKVEEDQIILEVQNDKAVVEVPSPVDGTVQEIVVSEGAVAVVGDTLITFEVTGAGNRSEVSEEAAQQMAQQEEQFSQTKEAKDVSTKNEKSKQTEQDAPSRVLARQVLATPSVRKLARQMGIDIRQIEGTGRHGQVTREDVHSFQAKGKEEVRAVVSAADTIAESTTAQTETTEVTSTTGVAINRRAEAPEERFPLKGIRKAIAQAMTTSVYTAPHVTIMDEVDVSKLVEFRQQMKPLAEKKGTKLTYLPFIVKALIAALRQYPNLNASFDEEKEEIIIKKYYHIGIATDTEAGLLVPVIFDADRKNMWQIAEEISDLATRGRAGKLSSAELKGSTMTITNIGSAGGMFFTPVINFPEVAILGVGKISKQPIVKDEEIAIASVMALSLSFDHRFIDGATAQHFINYLKQVLEDPGIFILEV